MTAPALAAQRFALACLLGLVPGAVYGFLRPLRPRFTAAADGIFLIVTAAVWLYHSFAICRGDLRLAYALGLAAGGLVWEFTAGRLLRPVFSAFWRLLGKILEILTFPAKKILHFVKILFASAEKWVTIKSRIHRHDRWRSGGLPNGRIKRIFKPHQAGPSAQHQFHQDHGDRYHRIVYGRDVPAAPCHDQGPE